MMTRYGFTVKNYSAEKYAKQMFYTFRFLIAIFILLNPKTAWVIIGRRNFAQSSIRKQEQNRSPKKGLIWNRTHQGYHFKCYPIIEFWRLNFALSKYTKHTWYSVKIFPYVFPLVIAFLFYVIPPKERKLLKTKAFFIVFLSFSTYYKKHFITSSYDLILCPARSTSINMMKNAVNKRSEQIKMAFSCMTLIKKCPRIAPKTKQQLIPK